MEVEGKEKERVTVKSVLSRKTNIAIIIGRIITGIAIAFVWIWATGSSALETLISVSMGVVFVAVFIVMAITAIRRSKEEEVERVVEILKRAKRIKEEIERRGEDLTSEGEIILSRMEVRLDGGLRDLKTGLKDLKSSLTLATSDLKSLILSGIGAMLALGISLITIL